MENFLINLCLLASLAIDLSTFSQGQHFDENSILCELGGENPFHGPDGVPGRLQSFIERVKERVATTTQERTTLEERVVHSKER